jgi:hypothetical protein
MRRAVTPLNRLLRRQIALNSVWREILNGAVFTSGPKNGGSPPSARSKNAADTCRDHGQRCTGYGR